MVRTTTNYPGVHTSLQGFPQAIESGDSYRVTGWKSRGFFGLYDLLGTTRDSNNTFTATLPGIYFVTGTCFFLFLPIKRRTKSPSYLLLQKKASKNFFSAMPILIYTHYEWLHLVCNKNQLFYEALEPAGLEKVFFFNSGTVST